MNIIQKWILGKEIVNQLKALQPGVKYALQNGRLISPQDNKTTYITEGYNKNDIIYSVINIILDKVRLPEWGLFKVVKESSLKEYQRIMKQKDISGIEYKKAMMLKEEALEPIDKFNLQQGKLNELLKYPNEYCTFQDFVTDGCGYKLLTGDVFIWGEVLQNGANIGIPNAMWILPSQHMTISVGQDFPASPVGYELMVWNKKFSTEQILHEKYWNPNWNFTGEQLYGFAPLRAFLKNITRNNAAKDSSAAKFQNGGLDTVLYFDDQRFSGNDGVEQAQALKLKLAQEYSGPTNQGKIATSGYKVGAVPLGNTPVELGIIDSEKWDAIMFCNGYGVPPELLGLTQKTYNNVKEAEKALTTRSAIPLLTSRRNSFNRKIQTDWGFKGQNIYIEYNTDCFTELQTNMTEVVAATSKMMMITPNEERELANMEARPEPEADEVWVLQGGSRVPLADYQQSVVDQALITQTTLDNVNGQGDQANGNGQVSPNGQGGGVSSGNGKNVRFTKEI